MPIHTDKYAVALGTFDGLHSAHLAVLKSALDSGYIPAVICFDAPPKSNEHLMTAEQKNTRLEAMGFKKVIFLNFNRVKDISPADFLDMVFERLNIAAVSCGFNYRFGCGAAGDITTLQNYCANKGAKLQVVPKVEFDGQTVSSSRIRTLIKNGDVDEANKMLTEPFGFSATVISGDRRGRTIDFPTINQELPAGLVRPKFGVYASSVLIDGREYKAVTNIGLRPTYELEVPLSETFIIGFDGSLYGQNITVALKKFIRPERKFSSIDELKTAIEKDKEFSLSLDM